MRHIIKADPGFNHLRFALDDELDVVSSPIIAWAVSNNDEDTDPTIEGGVALTAGESPWFRLPLGSGYGDVDTEAYAIQSPDGLVRDQSGVVFDTVDKWRVQARRDWHKKLKQKARAA